MNIISPSACALDAQHSTKAWNTDHLFFRQYTCSAGCQLVCSLTTITHPKQVLGLIKKGFGQWHTMTLNSHIGNSPSARRNTDPHCCKGVLGQGLHTCCPQTTAATHTTALRSHQHVQSNPHTSPLSALPLHLATTDHSQALQSAGLYLF